MLATVELMITRELRAIKRELQAYPDDASVWRVVPGTPNTGGTLALHVAGNIRHFFGGVLGRDGYVRDRDAEFARRDVPRADLLKGLDAAISSAEKTLRGLSAADLPKPYPIPIAERSVGTAAMITHLAVHLAYHLGQMDYHRRAVAAASGAEAKGVDAVSVRELPQV